MADFSLRLFEMIFSAKLACASPLSLTILNPARICAKYCSVDLAAIFAAESTDCKPTAVVAVNASIACVAWAVFRCDFYFH